MILFLLIDLHKDDWEMTTRDLFADVMIFLNAYQKSSRENRIIVVSSRRVIFDTLKDDISDIYSITTLGTRYSVNDLGYALCLHRSKESQIVIFTLREEHKDEYLRYIKCMFAAQRFRVKINAFSLVENKTILQCCASTGGEYFSNEAQCLRSLLSLLGTKKSLQPLEFTATCYCHGKQILLGLVCPICLSVFCKFIPVCKKCKSKFSFIKIEE
ncbi:RNA polymerase II transcription [Ordospora colligata]|uniref:General transcription and DNA repair factor IIH subunit TFB4 n=1 Tax=Ordospora colligata OC4 TaxID=1354746 RepID=A0A0B2UK49_9MICR|nr:RNA polymerase II transcription [Ordospora colligata OC4]KHN69350.1 RNA polymerase II transcription [Ordospora colligata OC4]TBU14864.1 RNA polymerase II transcription [Ordospora colligata]TBU14995.1 RNA polymerase II transcription [Ordospora colligata]TBU18249.1 RNA polymerase II transcription [Ordospora colligata]